MKSLGMASTLALLLSIDIAAAGSSDVQLATAEPASQGRPMTPIQRQPQIAMLCFYDSQDDLRHEQDLLLQLPRVPRRHHFGVRGHMPDVDQSIEPDRSSEAPIRQSAKSL